MEEGEGEGMGVYARAESELVRFFFSLLFVFR